MFLLSCSQQSSFIRLTHERKLNEEHAINFIWQHFTEYAGEQTGTRNIPIVEWYNEPYIKYRNEKLYGLYIPEIKVAVVAWFPPNTRFSQTSLAHELCHAYFGGGHDVCNSQLPPVESANALLRALGM